MNEIRTTLAVLAIAFAPGAAIAEPKDPLTHNLLPPQLVLEKANDLGLTEEQRKAVQKAGQAAHEAAQKIQPGLKQAMEELNKTLGAKDVSEEAAMAKLEKILAAERAMKRIHLKMLVRVNGALSTEQRKKLLQYRETQSERNEPASIEAKLKAKLKRVQEGVQAQMEVGSQPFDVVNLMKEFPEFMKLGKHAQAEALLDKAIGLLERGKIDKAPKKQPEKPTSFKSTKELDREIAAMRVDEVEWKKIAWKTCLLEGIAASKKQKKPIALWVFIDRPIDDKRC